MRGRAALLAGLLMTVVLAGCASDETNEEIQDAPGVADERLPTLPGFSGLPVNQTPVLSEPLIVDDVRAGGEPVIAVTQEGTLLVSSHPGWTHYHPSEDPTHPGAELLTPANAQSYLWRSTDGGATWEHVNLEAAGTRVPVDNVPRSAALGVSDPEFTVMADGTICMTDLIALASSSTSCSTDDGQTWLPGNSLAAGGVNDRQWLASWEDEFYFTANYFASDNTDNPGGHHIRASTDRGMTWENRGNVPCSQDVVANPHNGDLVVACGAGISVSEDGGWTWTERLKVPNATEGQRVMAEPAIDAAGTIWVTWAEGEDRLWVAGTPDDGATWPWVIDLTPHFNLFSQQTEMDLSMANSQYDRTAGTNGSYVWPWISAGSDGRVAVTWIGGFSETDSATYNDPWFLFSAFILDAATEAPSVTVLPLTPSPIHFGPICQSGTTCQVTSVTGNDSGDRRLGDFFETTIDHDGYLHAVVSDTYTRSDDVISHVNYVRQVGGVPLITAEDLDTGWRATQG